MPTEKGSTVLIYRMSHCITARFCEHILLVILSYKLIVIESRGSTGASPVENSDTSSPWIILETGKGRGLLE
jgi:hypothetical protein